MHASLAMSAARIRSGEIDAGSWTSPPALAVLPVHRENNGCGGGCTSCCTGQ
jgi:hypothetical protein